MSFSNPELREITRIWHDIQSAVKCVGATALDEIPKPTTPVSILRLCVRADELSAYHPEKIDIVAPMEDNVANEVQS